MSLREENEKRDRQLKKEADLFRTGFNAGLDAAVEAGNFLPYSEPINNRRAAYNHAINDYQEAINKLRGD